MTKAFTFSIGKEDLQIGADNWDELIGWVEKERAHWDWLQRGSTTDVNNIATNVRTHWDGMFNELNSGRNQNADLATAVGYLGQLNGSGLLLTSNTMRGRTVLDVLKSAGPVSAAYAYAFLTGNVTFQNINTPEGFLGILLTAVPNLNNVAELEKRLKAERHNYSSSLRSQSARLDEEFCERASSFERLIKRGKLVGLNTLRKRKASFDEMVSRWQDTADTSVADINGVKDTFQQFMELEAPVKYWSDKADQHGTKAVSAAWHLGIFFAAFIVVMAVSFGVSGSFILNHPETIVEGKVTKQNPVALYFLISAGLAILSTVGFWAGRILSKLYLSEHHLKTDAEERAVMTKTYLALTETGAATEADKQIILSALFRATADGIVRDDGPSDIGLQAIASKLLTQGRT